MAEFKDLPTKAYAELDRAARLERIDEAFFNLVTTASILKNATRAELADIARKGELADVNTQANIRTIGAHLLQLAEINIETHSIVAATLRKSTAVTELPRETVPITVPAPAPHKLETRPPRPQAVHSISKSTQTKAEKQPTHGNKRLYSRIVTAEEIPPIELDEDADPIEIHITSDDTITFNGEEIKLEGDSLFLFNAYMMLRNQPTITANDIRKLGFQKRDSKSDAVALSNAISEFRKTMRNDDCPEPVELILRKGKAGGTTYQVSPVVIMTDFVREGTTVTVEFLGEEGDNQSTVRITSRYKKHNPDSPVKEIGNNLPITTQLFGARQGDAVSFMNNEGMPVKVRVISIK